jgi:2-polyprenyl-6-hydroxyphenyl methylase/3-demethylubiquinone-9 3-methyltransferase
MIYFFYIVIVVAKFLVTFKNPFNKERGMNFYYDVIDWVGGYPYEYASRNQIENFLNKKGFKLIKFYQSQAPTGCYEYVFERIQ